MIDYTLSNVHSEDRAVLELWLGCGLELFDGLRVTCRVPEEFSDAFSGLLEMLSFV